MTEIPAGYSKPDKEYALAAKMHHKYINVKSARHIIEGSRCPYSLIGTKS
jgi:hypothetical protein